MPLPGTSIPSTAGKLAFVSDRAGTPDVWMMNGDGTNPVQITRNGVRAEQPAWSASGKEIAFIDAKSDKESPQVYLADAIPGRNAVAVTRTSGAKSKPVWDGSQVVNFLDTGKLASYDTSAQETEGIFPEAEQKRAIAALFPGGSIVEAYPLGPHTHALVMNVEEGQLLLLYQFDHNHENDMQLVMAGAAEKITLSPLQNGGFIAAFENGQPSPSLVPLMNAQSVKTLSVQGDMEESKVPPIGTLLRVQKGNNIVALFDSNANVQSGIRIPFPVKEIQAASDGSKFILLPAINGKTQGVFVANPKAQEGLQQIVGLPAENASLSPDGSQVAFQSGNDVYVMPTDGGEAKNLTQGKGKNSVPTWSPTIAEAKK